MRAKIFILVFMLFLVAVLANVSAQSASYVTYQPRASFQAVYGPEDRLVTYWPILGDKDSCEARQDLILQVAPAGCQPSVVRSDLLAEQNVPVFCQIDALQVNPLLDIDQIRSIRFSGKYPNEVVGAGYHPARAALRSRDKLLGSPLINNIGYVVVVLKRNPVEKELPELVSVNLTAQIDYNAGNAFGVGSAKFVLEPMSDAEWEQRKFENSFWNGRYFVRLEDADSNFVTISIYSGDRKIATTKVERGKTSREIYVPGAYCRAGIQIAYDGFVDDKDRARIEISDSRGTDRIDVVEGTSLLDGKCRVNKIDVTEDGAGNVSFSCGSRKIELRLEQKQSVGVRIDGEEYSIRKIDIVKFVGIIKETEPSYKENLADFIIHNGNAIDSWMINGKVYSLAITKDATNPKIVVGSYSEDGIIKIDNFVFEERSPNNPDIVGHLRRINGVKYLDLAAGKIEDKELSEEISKEVDEAIAALRKVPDEYPAEKEADVEGADRFGEKALVKAIELAYKAERHKTRAELMEEFVKIYPDSGFTEGYVHELNRMERIDFGRSIGVIELDGRFWNVRLLSLEKPTKKSSIELSVTGVKAETVKVELREIKSVTSGGKGTLESVRLDNIDNEEQIRITAFCEGESGKSYSLRIDSDAEKVCDKSFVKLRDVKLEEIAKVRLLPKVQGTRTETNLSVTIGIEKRAIKLSPEKTEEMIERMDENVKKWENINARLGEIVSGMKGACFGTAAVLTAKNFLTGISGEALARQKVMGGEEGWTRKCSEAVARGEHVSLDACYLANADKINNDVSVMQKEINSINERIKSLEQPFEEGTNLGGIFSSDKSIDRSKAAVAYCEELLSRKGSEKITTKDGEKSLNDLIGGKEGCQKAYESGIFGYNELRDIELQLNLKNSVESSDSVKENANFELRSGYNNILQNKQRSDEVEKAKLAREKGLPIPSVVTASRGRVVAEVVSIGGLKDEGLKKVAGDSENFAGVVVDNSEGRVVGDKERKGFESGTYLLGLRKVEGGYNVEKVFKQKADGSYEDLSDRRGEFFDIYNIGIVIPAEKASYVNPYENPEIRYYETEPYKGMPAIVPFDVSQGWYAATRQTLPTFGGIGSFDASGRVTSFWLCNVGENKREQFFEGFGDDICQLINLNTGQPLGFFPGLSETEARALVGKAVEAVQRAAEQYGKRIITINGRELRVGNPAANIPSVQCQNFMSPQECHLMFNVCDPVICPSSRCDLGGNFPVADVIQTGIVGSALLCLPNVQEGIAVPVCLTGIHAGIDGFVSIMKGYRDCLNESLETGRTVGICDQIHSIYMCEFFWRQISPAAKVILPKLVETVYGQGTRGGGEYLTVMSAWENTQNSIQYFTQSYAVNSLNAFKVRNVEEAGTPICKAFVSAKAPSSFESLVEPDSPPQFHAWFSSTRFTDATVPATSQYKVFYHIFAGNDQGVHYSVYLKNPPESSFYTIPQFVQVAAGFVGRGQYVDETRDFTAPEGYKELCVRINDNEECGFKEVGTSFALDYLSDKYAGDELQQSDIKSERECISGSPNIGALVQPNVQAGVEEALIPSVSDRGIVRICSTENPGSKTEPTRFVDVGYCGDEKIRCWLDKKSVENSISDNNKGLRNETLSVIEARQREDLARKGVILGDDQANAEIKTVSEEIEKLRPLDIEISDEKFNEIIGRLNVLLEKVVLNHHKANVLYLVGDLRAIRAEKNLPRLKIESTVKGVEEKEEEASTTTSIKNKYYLVKSEGTESREFVYVDTGKGVYYTGIYIVKTFENEQEKITIIASDVSDNNQIVGEIQSDVIYLRYGSGQKIISSKEGIINLGFDNDVADYLWELKDSLYSELQKAGEGR